MTILLPLKGRELHTLRFLYHANQIELPFPILIADGWVNPHLAGLLEEKPHLFSNIHYQYIRYPNDDTRSRFYQKMADAVSRVMTPYVMLVDNDDFLCPEGIRRCLAFLDAAPDYVSCGGGVAGFSIAEHEDRKLYNIAGRMIRLDYRYSPNYVSRDLSSDCTTHRTLDGYRNYMTTYYNVFRTDASTTIHKELADLDFSDVEIHESYYAMRALTLGKERSDPSVISYLRQNGTSLASAFGEHDWVHHLLRSRFTSDFDFMTSRIAALCHEADGTDPAFVIEEIRQIFGDGLRILLSRRYGKGAAPSTWRRAVAALLPQWLRRMRRRLIRSPSSGREAVFERLRADGAGKSYLDAFARELNSVDGILHGKEFPAFVRAQAPYLLNL